LVDLPGVGYAEVRREKRLKWQKLFSEFVQTRSTLSCLFHLIDSRHGFLTSDHELLDVLEILPAHVQYAIVLTKADKKGGGLNIDSFEKIKNIISEKQSSLKNEFSRNRKIPILLTSSLTKQGGAEVWSVMLDAIANSVEKRAQDAEINAASQGEMTSRIITE
jgi:GTP-binding protein